MSNVQATREHSAKSAGEAQYLSFSLGTDDYAVEIERVREILGMRPITPVPQTPPHVLGVMNLRGLVVPVVDMRSALGLPSEECGKFHVILVLAVQARTIGFIVDKVSDVLTFTEAAVDRHPDFGSPVASSFVGGIARNDERLVILLDVERIVAAGGRALEALARGAASPSSKAVVAPPPPAAEGAAASPQSAVSSSRGHDALFVADSWDVVGAPDTIAQAERDGAHSE